MKEQLYSANQIAILYGKEIVGRYVLTERLGDWPGGLALVTEWMPDVENDLVLTVKQGAESVGVFTEEALIVIPNAFNLPDGIV